MKRFALGLTILVSAGVAAAQPQATHDPAACPLHAQHLAAGAPASDPARPYAELQGRELAALSGDEAEALRSGSGHGIALPAELHHYPGPRHVLDLGERLQLRADQRAALERIFERMHRRAVQLGDQILAGERELESAFADGTATVAGMERQTAELARLRGELRAAHLAAHVETRALLDPDQIARYDMERGYGERDQKR